MAMEKVYTGTLRLGEATPSFDAETDVSERRPWQHLSDADLAAARDGFLGDIMQLPPMYSAISVKGAQCPGAARRSQQGIRHTDAVWHELWDHSLPCQPLHVETC